MHSLPNAGWAQALGLTRLVEPQGVVSTVMGCGRSRKKLHKVSLGGGSCEQSTKYSKHTRTYPIFTPPKEFSSVSLDACVAILSFSCLLPTFAFM